MKYDILIAGAGPAGICAALSAADMGMRVLLIERSGIVGGGLTIHHVTPIMGQTQAATLAYKISQELHGYYKAHDFEYAKLYLCELLNRPEITVLLDTVVTDVCMKDNRITGLCINQRSGNTTVEADIVIDCTGDGSVAALAGAPFDMGREDGLCQPVSIMFVINGCDPAQTIKCRHERENTALPKGNYLELCEKACADVRLPKTVNLVRLYAGDAPDERMVNATQMNGINGLDGQALFRAQIELRRQIKMVVDFLRETIPGFENIQVKSSSDTVGVRETRRIRGLHILTAEEISAHVQFPDTIAHNVCFPIDIHTPDGAGQTTYKNLPSRVSPYDIPYRCLVPLCTDGLLLAGRCISGDHGAHASYRTMNICGTIGEAAGIAATLCVKSGIQPRALNAAEIQRVLQSRGIEMPQHIEA